MPVKTVIYVTSLTIIGLLLPYDEPRLLGGSGANASPFVIALDKAKIYGLNREYTPFDSLFSPTQLTYRTRLRQCHNLCFRLVNWAFLRLRWITYTLRSR